jgi:hypothetical protein
MSVRIVVSPQVLVLTRTETLYRVVREFVEATAGYTCPDTVRRGVVEHPYLERIYVVLVNAKREKVAEVNLAIDWGKHRVFANVQGMEAFRIDEGQPVASQISAALGELSRFVSTLRGSPGISAEVWYGVRSDAGVSYEEACRVLGLVPHSKQLEWAKGKYMATSFRAARLEELQVDIRTKVE